MKFDCVYTFSRLLCPQFVIAPWKPFKHHLSHLKERDRSRRSRTVRGYYWYSNKSRRTKALLKTSSDVSFSRQKEHSIDCWQQTKYIKGITEKNPNNTHTQRHIERTHLLNTTACGSTKEVLSLITNKGRENPVGRFRQMRLWDWEAYRLCDLFFNQVYVNGLHFLMHKKYTQTVSS